MKPISLQAKQCLFAGATKRTYKPRTTKPRKRTTKKPFTEKAGPSMSGMLMAAGLGEETFVTPVIDHPHNKKTKAKKYTSYEKSKFDFFSEEINKYGMIALTMGTIANHATNVSFKFNAALKGDDESLQEYVEKSKSYLKPHFSLPSQWHQSRITFGTPWYY